ncbi:MULTISPECIES: oligopeptide:H+ symporter [unclassified Streptomyces]|uniref:peptide MFS transporter n=1 Tax=unclassified Streptomyces TaxID=2593676 RepID=UPI00332B1B0F
MTAEPVTRGPRDEQPEETGLLGRPRWFTTLFGTDVWERFSFYGMSAILVLYASEPVADGGLGLSDDDAALLFGSYMAAVFLSSVPGGWIGDRLLGSYRAVLYGGVVIGLGHLTLAVPSEFFFYPGLLLVALGTGLLKPNMANLLSTFYAPEDRSGRDAGFAVFYMSVQVSALIAPLIVGTVGEGVNWHLGFGLAALGMALGLIQYVRGARHFGANGKVPERAAAPAQRAAVLRWSGAAAGLVAVGYGVDAAFGTFQIGHVMALVGLLCVVAPAAAFWRLIRNPLLTAAERSRVKTYIWLFLVSAVFWGLFLQGGSVFALFAKDSTDRDVLGFTIPASWFQSTIPLFVLLTAPFFARAWQRAGERLDTAVKFAVGMGCTGAAYLVLAAAALLVANTGEPVSPLWLVVSFLLLACGEVSFGPVGMSATTAIAPATFVSQMVALFWLAGALGGGLGGNALKVSGEEAPGAGYFLSVGAVALLVGAILLLVRRPLTRKLGV